MREALKKERTTQVQFRMSAELHFQLRKVLLDNGISMADLFNDTAKEYVKKQQQDKSKGEKKNG